MHTHDLNTYISHYRDIVDDDNLWNFVEDHMADDIGALRLRFQRRTGSIDYDTALTQIECRQRFGRKLADTLAHLRRFLFADELLGEQATSDYLARFHASLVDSGQSVSDLTAGAGIDLIHMSRRGCPVSACELNVSRAAALAVNAGNLDIQLRHMVCGDCRDHLEHLAADVAFIDPARRNEAGRRVYSLADCAPDVCSMRQHLVRYFNRLIVKASPMLDISAVATGLPGLRHIYAIGTTTECRELLVDCSLNTTSADDDFKISAVTITGDTIDVFTYDPRDKHQQPMRYGTPAIGDYVVVPYPSMMKIGAVHEFAGQYGLTKIAPNTHVYFSTDRPVASDLQAQVLRVVDVVQWQSKHLKRFASKWPMGWVATRNMGMSASDLQNKLKVKSGGDIRILGVCTENDTRLILVLRP